jgi:hypothetical protein
MYVTRQGPEKREGRLGRRGSAVPLDTHGKGNTKQGSLQSPAIAVYMHPTLQP